MSAAERGRAWQESPAALLVLDRDGGVVDANATFLRWSGRSAAQVTGRARLSELLSVGGRIYWETHVAPLLHMQGRVDELAVELRGPDGRRPVLLSAVVRPGGEIDVVLSGAQERSRYERELLAARRAAESSTQRVRALQRTTAAFSRASDVGGVVEALLATSVEHLGAAVARVWLVGPDGRLAGAGSTTGPGTAPARAPDSPDAGVATDGTAVVALRGASRWHGVAQLWPRTGPTVDPWDLAVLTAVGQQAGQALDRARLFDESATVAHELQRALLTTNVPSDPRLSIATEYRPAVQSLEVGGDWYDAFTVGDVVAVVVGDVVGRGLQAAVSMGQLRSAVRAAAGPGVGPAAVLSHVDRFVERAGVGFMATMVYAEVEPATGRVRYAAAGHPPPLRLTVDGTAEFLWDGRSTPLGAPVAARPRTDAVVDLVAGDRLLLYTDGLVERRDRPLADGLDDLAGSARGLLGPSGSAAGLVDAAAVRRGDDRDDICVLLATWSGPAAP
ncbi:hypothetical protein Cch01nite_34730 [Cellulomonas chitinilytica]|uniref:PAS domain-containing protein n=1 Tax=Cellulomonas chitinilytica TaxID=398759 RepID=A0A919U440_9CELL|nr:SpoIIE family protein phosphatase [Cellulomonas chitinilytica]GIG22749.1 hypothetical protein Cch01nite_34730 [Cellulomonas chitinilytica]